MNNNVQAKSNHSIPFLTMPDESDLHERTWMAFVANDDIWSPRQVPEVKKNLALIATTIAQYEPVSMLVSPDDYDDALSLLGDLKSNRYPIDLIRFKTDDLWLRDTGPTFVKGADGNKYGIDFNFNGWGNKQQHKLDAQVAEFISHRAKAVIRKSTLTLEGGCFEVDGNGTAIMTKSCIINSNRNPGISQEAIETELKALLGLRKIIWLEGIKGKDITDGHTDFYARFTRPGEVIVSRDNFRPSYDYEVTRNNIETLKNSTDADGNKLRTIILDTPDQINEKFGSHDFAAGYIGYYACNNAIIAQKFGDKKSDDRAKAALQQAFPDRVVEQIAIDGIASGGGSIHCATQQEIKIQSKT
ncbi:agmatine deiminase family protein [Aestuariirhabdus sp. Z084]|uniref:agmatine deiminase family protein n=1 Tax=Aestuariirhabdus haliotis TaxID=2918751 RepID=UPI00201B3C78|nr:agmatine deiminase family protein [Aestuariirhabdus haliotis]MCL6415144.1 agmatine deiminase family protein [Aestuariirhabdus haliotis]MCL6420019.1 agmatine deiminase family protein [Aestuariirhabdus haliotis]